jgi:malonate transporter
VSWVVAGRLLSIFAVIALGWAAGRTRPLAGPQVVTALSNAAFNLFTPALLFRTTARIDLATLPWATLAAFFGPVVGLMLGVYGWQRLRPGGGPLPPAGPAVRAISTTFGNTVQLGIPVVTAVFGQAGLPLHIAIVSLHALTLLTVVTALAELDLARAGVHAEVDVDAARLTGTAQVGERYGSPGDGERYGSPGDGERDGSPGDAGGTGPGQAVPAGLGVLRQTVRRTVIHPVVLPVLAGLAWNLLRIPVPAPLDELLVTLGQGVVPVSLVVIGLSLRQFGLGGVARQAGVLSAGKLLVQPALVLVAAHWGAGLRGLPLGVVVMAAGLPIGSNALLFAQRYRTLEAEATAGIVLSMVGFVATAPLWLLAVSWLS